MGHKNYTKYNKMERKEFNESSSNEKITVMNSPNEILTESIEDDEPVKVFEVHVNKEDDDDQKISVNVRKKPEDGADILTSIPEETIIHIKRMVDAKWASISFKDIDGNEHSGFMMRQYIREVE